MKIEEIEIGGRYYHFFGEIIEVEDISGGRSRPRVHCRSLKNSREKLIHPSELTSIEDYREEERLKAQRLQDNRRRAREIMSVAGEGARIDGRVLDSEVTLLFTEEAALRLLEACGANMPGKDQLPSGAKSRGGHAALTTKLSGRLRRALKAGHTGDWTGAYLASQGGRHQAMIRLESAELEVALSSIYQMGGPEETANPEPALAQLI